MTIIKTALAVAVLALVATSANAHDYKRYGNEISKSDHWDVRSPAPFARDEFERFTQ